MAYENINVRMTRSNQTIQWGFQLRQQGNSLAISFVQADSMADKAGVRVGDTVETIFGLKPQNINDAQSRIQSTNEVSMNLKRFVANPPNMPWTLEDKGNQIVVNHFDKSGRVSGVSDQNTAGYQNSFQSTQSLGGGAPFSEETRRITNIKRTETREGPAGSFPTNFSSNNENLPFSNTVKSESHSNWDQDEGNIKKHYETNRTYTRTESSNVSPGGAITAGSGAAPFSHGSSNNNNQISNFSSTNNWQQGGQDGGNSGSYSNVKWSQNQGTGEWDPNHRNSSWNQNQQQNWSQSNNQNSGANWGQGNNQSSWGGQGGGGGGAPWSQSSQNQYGSSGFGGGQQGKHVTVQTPQSGQYHGQDTGYPGSQGGGNYRNKSTTPNRGQSMTPTHYDGPRAYYSRSPRTVRELSPHATVAHLQYNSPLGMYSPEAAAEAYKMQTGQDLPIDGDYPRGNRPAYLDSATRRLIAEQEQGIRHRSPTPQSSALKRIAHAVGAD
jgi:hypothetical protein